MAEHNGHRYRLHTRFEDKRTAVLFVIVNKKVPYMQREKEARAVLRHVLQNELTAQGWVDVHTRVSKREIRFMLQRPSGLQLMAESVKA